MLGVTSWRRYPLHLRGAFPMSRPFLLLLLRAFVTGAAVTGAAAESSQAWKRGVPFEEASAGALTAANAVINQGGSEECLRGKLSNAILQLSNSCDVSGRSSSVCEMASEIAGRESELSMGEMLSTSESLIQMLGDQTSSR